MFHSAFTQIYCCWDVANDLRYHLSLVILAVPCTVCTVPYRKGCTGGIKEIADKNTALEKKKKSKKHRLLSGSGDMSAGVTCLGHGDPGCKFLHDFYHPRGFKCFRTWEPDQLLSLGCTCQWDLD